MISPIYPWGIKKFNNINNTLDSDIVPKSDHGEEETLFSVLSPEFRRLLLLLAINVFILQH